MRLPDNAEIMAAAVDDCSAEAVAAAAHKLKSSSRSVGAMQMADLCEALEEAGRSDDWGTIGTSAPRLPGIDQEIADFIMPL